MNSIYYVMILLNFIKAKGTKEILDGYNPLIWIKLETEGLFVLYIRN